VGATGGGRVATGADPSVEEDPPARRRTRSPLPLLTTAQNLLRLLAARGKFDVTRDVVPCNSDIECGHAAARKALVKVFK
jgi:hypothetical protein